MLISHIDLKNIQKSKPKTSFKVSKSIKKPTKESNISQLLVFKSNNIQIDKKGNSFLKIVLIQYPKEKTEYPNE